MPRPATPSRDGSELSPEAVALAAAVARWRERHPGRFPAWSDVCGILLALGWRPPPEAPIRTDA